MVILDFDRISMHFFCVAILNVGGHFGFCHINFVSTVMIYAAFFILICFFVRWKHSFYFNYKM